MKIVRKLLIAAAAIAYLALAAYAIDYAARTWPSADIGNGLF